MAKGSGVIPIGPVVRISDSHSGGPGSIPGWGKGYVFQHCCLLAFERFQSFYPIRLNEGGCVEEAVGNTL